MLANFFGKSKPITFIVILILYVFLYLIAILNNHIAFEGQTIPVFLFLFGLINFIIIKNRLTFDNSYAFLFFVILTAFFYRVNYANTVFFTNLILLIFLRRVYSFKSSKNLLIKIFDSGLWLGIAFIREPLTIVFLPFIYSGIFLYQQLNFRTLLIPVLGLFTPVVLVFTYFFWFDKLYEINYLWSFFNFLEVSYTVNKQFLIPVLFCSVLIGLSILLKSSRVKISFKRSWYVILCNFSFSLVLFFLLKEKTENEFLYLFFPSSLILANGIELINKKWLKETILILLLIGAIVFNFL